MSSVLRAYAQIPARAKYFLYDSGSAVSDESVPTTSIFSLNPGAYAELTSMATAAEVNDAPGFNSDFTPAQNLLKDMGRQITIYDPNTSAHLAVYREVQVVDGIGSEGVGGTANAWQSNIFVKVWSADGQGVVVMRTG
jgi:hypothetical protein